MPGYETAYVIPITHMIVAVHATNDKPQTTQEHDNANVVFTGSTIQAYTEALHTKAGTTKLKKFADESNYVMIYGCENCHHSWEGPVITDIDGNPIDVSGYKCTECGHWNYIKDSLKRFTGEGLTQLISTENGV